MEIVWYTVFRYIPYEKLYDTHFSCMEFFISFFMYGGQRG